MLEWKPPRGDELKGHRQAGCSSLERNTSEKLTFQLREDRKRGKKEIGRRGGEWGQEVVEQKPPEGHSEIFCPQPSHPRAELLREAGNLQTQPDRSSLSVQGSTGVRTELNYVFARERLTLCGYLKAACQVCNALGFKIKTIIRLFARFGYADVIPTSSIFMYWNMTLSLVETLLFMFPLPGCVIMSLVGLTACRKAEYIINICW